MFYFSEKSHLLVFEFWNLAFPCLKSVVKASNILKKENWIQASLSVLWPLWNSWRRWGRNEEGLAWPKVVGKCSFVSKLQSLLPVVLTFFLYLLCPFSVFSFCFSSWFISPTPPQKTRNCGISTTWKILVLTFFK